MDEADTAITRLADVVAQALRETKRKLAGEDDVGDPAGFRGAFTRACMALAVRARRSPLELGRRR